MSNEHTLESMSFEFQVGYLQDQLRRERQAREQADKRLTNLRQAAYEHLLWNDSCTHHALQDALAACEEKPR